MRYEQPALFELSDQEPFADQEPVVLEGLNEESQSLYWDMADRRQDQGVANGFMMNIDPEAGWPAKPPRQQRPVEDGQHWQPQSAERIEVCRQRAAEIREMLAAQRHARGNQ